MLSKTFKPSAQFVLILYSLIGLCIFGYSLGFGFLLDDEDQVLKNEFIHSFAHLWDLFLGSTMNSGGAAILSGIYYKPIMMLSYMILWFITPADAKAFHFFQLTLHILNAFLIYRIFARLFRDEPFSKIGTTRKFDQSVDRDQSDSAQGIVALFCGLIFLVHPINVESVVHIANLQENLYSFFGLVALNILASTFRPNVRLLTLIGCLLLLALLSKESGILYLAIILPYCFFFKPSYLKQAIFVDAAVVIVYLILRVGLANLTTTSFNTSKMHRADLLTRLTSMPKVLWHYFETFLFPKHLTVTQDWAVTQLNLLEFWIPLILLVSTAGGLIALHLRKPSKQLIFFSIWAILGLGLHSQLHPLDGTVSDRWFYFTIVGFLGILGSVIPSRVLGIEGGTKGATKARTKAAALVCVVLIVSLGVRSWVRTLDWKDPITLYTHDLELLPDSYFLNNNLGVELFRRGKIAESKPYFEKSTQLFPEWTVNWNNLGAVYEQSGDLQFAETCYERAIKNGAYHLAFENYARALRKQAKFDQLRDFLTQTGLRVFPNNPILLGYYWSLPAS